jgi:tetratricopeptide (TPR) repeat protein
MRALLAALEADPVAARRARVRSAGVGIAFATLLAISAWGVVRAADAPAACPDPALALQGTWNDARRARLPLGADRGRVLAALDDYAGRWVAMNGAACRAARIERTETEHLHELRGLCLEERRVALDAVLRVLEEQPLAAGRGVIAVRALPPLDACADRAWLLARVKPPADPAVAARVEQIRRLAERATALNRSGQYAEAAAPGREAYALSREVDYLPARAEAAVVLGFSLAYSGAGREALPIVGQAVHDALRSRHYAVAARAWDWLIWGFSTLGGDRAAALRAANDAEALLDGLPGHEVETASVLGRRGWLRASEHAYAQAFPDLRRSLEIRRRVLGADHPETGFAHVYLAAALFDGGDYVEARAEALRARDLFRDHVSPFHPEHVRAALLAARCLGMLARYDAALPELHALLAWIPVVLGRDPFAVGAEVHEALNFVLRGLGRHQEALAHGRAAIATFEARRRDDPRAIFARCSVARSLTVLGRTDEAGAELRSALERAEVVLAGKPELSIPLQGMALWHRERGERRRALVLLERALELRAGRGRTHPQLCELWRPAQELRAELAMPPLDHPRPDRCD